MESESFQYSVDAKGVQFFVGGEKAVGKVERFDDPMLGLNPTILRNVQFSKPTTIQSHAMPQLQEKLDVMCCSHTGSGKTAAYLLPIINRASWTVKPVLDAKGRRMPYGRRPTLGVFFDDSTESSKSSDDSCTLIPQASTPFALILVPTRELALQVCEEAKFFATGTGVQVLAVYGGDAMGKELRILKTGKVNIVVATPGRLKHILEEFDNVLDLGKTEFLVIDEADEMFNKGFFKQIEAIIKDGMRQKTERVTAMFSATFPLQIRYFAEKYLRADHVFVVIGIVGGAAPDVVQDVRCVYQMEKHSKILSLLAFAEDDNKKILVFCNTIDGVALLVTFLEYQQYSPACIHSNMPQAEREQALRDFHSGDKNILIATSVASRGLNIKNVNVVINYDMPREIADYVQRIGRTRKSDSGELGMAISFFNPDDDIDIMEDLSFVLRSVNQKLPDFLRKATERKKKHLDEIRDTYPYATDEMVSQMQKLEIKQPFGEKVKEHWWG